MKEKKQLVNRVPYLKKNKRLTTGLVGAGIVLGFAFALTGCTTFNVDSITMNQDRKAALEAASDMEADSAWEADSEETPDSDMSSNTEVESAPDADASQPAGTDTAKDNQTDAATSSDKEAGSSDEILAETVSDEPSDINPLVLDFHKAERERREALRDMQYDFPAKKINLGNLRNQSVVDEEYWASKRIKVKDNGKRSTQNLNDEQKFLTDREIIRSIVLPDVLNKKIDLDFDDAKLPDITMMIGTTGGFNIVLDPQFKTLVVDLHLKQVSLEEALVLIAKSYNLGMKLVENSLYLTSIEKLKDEKILSKVYRIKNISAKEASTMIGGLADSVTVSEPINSLIVRGSADQMVKVDRLMDIIDTPQLQVLIEAKIIEIKKGALNDLGIKWPASSALNFKEGGRPPFDDPLLKNNALQVFGKFERTPIEMAATFQFLEEANKAKLLANPRISTINGKDASIFVGDSVPYTVSTVTGGVASTETRFVEAGIRLNILPSIVEDDFVVMEVKPEVSSITGFKGANGDIPQVTTSQALASVRIRNKETVVIGGLLSQKQGDDVSKVPYLGSIPLLGNLFSTNKKTAEDTELIITVTPTIVRGEI